MPEGLIGGCRHSGCPERGTNRGYCPEHAALRQQRINQNRDHEAERLYHTGRWKRVRVSYLKRHPVCEACHEAPASHVDHVVPHHGDPDVFWDRSNWQSLCPSCHSRKTMNELRESMGLPTRGGVKS